ncbi:MAG: NAD-dependent epimerase/dehydratase family protein [Coriobacteriia bacterium]|nr:NAD-dependent epimerase/dehydratase family protein [Coriobacteriia bacterium]
MIEGKRVLLTGGAGFIGTALARELAPHNEVILFDNLHRDSFTGTSLSKHPNVTFVRGDVLDTEALSAAMAGCQIVVHLAAIAGVDSVLRSPVRTMKVNVIGTFNVLEAAHRAGSVERVVDFSTSEIFGTHAYKVEETHISPVVSVGEARWTYAVGKLAGEFIGHSYWHEHGLPVTTVRPFNVYGPGQTGEGAVHHFIKRAISNQPLVIHGDGSQIRAWCYVDDMVRGVMRVLECDAACGEAFNIGNPRSTLTIYDLALKVIRLAGSSSPIEFKPLGYVDIEVRIPDISKAREMLGYEPQVDLEEGLSRTIAWYREREGLA